MIAVPITINRVSGEIVTVKPDAGSTVQKQLMGDIVATLSFELNAMYNFAIGDFADIFGETFYLAKPAIVTKKSKFNYQYTLNMDSKQYKLRNAQYMFYNAQNVLSEGDFSLTGTADDFMNLLILNANRIGETWIKGGVIASGYKTLTFSKEDCLSVLAKIAEAFETEFYVDGNAIHLAKRKQITSNTFMYGRNLGLYTIGREVTDDELFTRLYVFGGTQNLPTDYPSTRLRLPGGYDNLVHNVTWTIAQNPDLPDYNNVTITFDFPTNPNVTHVMVYSRIKGMSAFMGTGTTGTPVTILASKTQQYEIKITSKNALGEDISTTPFTDLNPLQDQQSPIFTLGNALPYLENNTNLYGVVEGTIIIDDIFPQREGTITSTDVTNFYTFKDVNIDFDINNQLAPGMSAKVVFQTGQLAGYKFEISKFNNSTKEFTLLKNKDEKALDLPSAMLRPMIGDKYILVDIIMPASYVTNAELQLQAKAMEYLQTKSQPSYKYVIECDPAYFRKQKIYLEIGDVVQIIDNELQVNKPIRIVSLTRSLVDEFEYSLELGETPAKGTIAALQSSTTINSSNIYSVSNQVNNNALLNGTFIGTLKIEQGTINIKDIETATSTSGMNQLWIDASGKVWKV